jgi:hypothetical protein
MDNPQGPIDAAISLKVLRNNGKYPDFLLNPQDSIPETSFISLLIGPEGVPT